MADDALNPAPPSTLHITGIAPDSLDDLAHSDPVKAATKQWLLEVLANIPRDELPVGDDRNALRWLIEHGYVDNLYTPVGHDTHTIAWAHRPAWQDPRETVADWLAACRTYEETGEMDPRRKELADAER